MIYSLASDLFRMLEIVGCIPSDDKAADIQMLDAPGLFQNKKKLK